MSRIRNAAVWRPKQRPIESWYRVAIAKSSDKSGPDSYILRFVVHPRMVLPWSGPRPDEHNPAAWTYRPDHAFLFDRDLAHRTAQDIGGIVIKETRSGRWTIDRKENR